MIKIKSVFQKALVFIVIILLLTAFSSSYNSLNIDKLAYVVAIGIDTSEKNNLRVSFQFTNASSVSETGSSEKSPSIIDTVDASSISTAVNLMNTYIGKKINLSHCKVIVFSESIATEGISKQIYTLINDTQIRPSANIVVSKCDAKYYIENSKPSFENLITKYYDIFPSSSDYTAYTVNATIGDFLYALECKTCSPTAILGGMNTENSNTNSSLNTNKDSSVKSNESSISGKRGSENIGVAVFKEDKLVGELNAIECLAFLNLKNEAKGFLISVPDPNEINSYIDVYLTPDNNLKIDVNIINGSPYIKIKANYSGRIHSVTSESAYLDSQVLDNINKSCNSYLESIFSNYLYKTSRDFKSDINRFGKFCLSKFLTTKDFENYNWLDNYKNSFFDVDVETSIESSLLLTET